jgi:RNA polymerase sigma factor (sigma-70 family)
MSDVLATLLESDLPWLRDRKSAAPDLLRRLGARLEGWWRGAAVEMGVPAGSANRAYLERYWRCWKHHWERAAENAAAHVGGLAVADCLEQGLQHGNGKSLGGKPIFDLTLAQAVLDRVDDAVVRFDKEHAGFCQAQMMKTVPDARSRVAEWWADLSTELQCPLRGGRPARLASFLGQAGIRPWLGQVARHFALDRVRQTIKVQTGSPPAEPAAPPELPAAELSSCMELFRARVRDAYGTLGRNELLAMYYRHVHFFGQERIANILGVHQGTVHRQLLRAKEALREALSAGQEEEVRDCLALLSPHDEPARAFGDVLMAALRERAEAGDALEARHTGVGP